MSMHNEFTSIHSIRTKIISNSKSSVIAAEVVIKISDEKTR